MRKRTIKGQLDAAQAELDRLRAEVTSLELEGSSLRAELDAERDAASVRAVPAGSQPLPGAPHAGPGRRIVHLQATVIDDPDQGQGGQSMGAELRARLTRGIRDAETLLAAAEPTPPVRAARYALSFALRAEAAQPALEAGGQEPGTRPALPLSSD